MRRLEGKIALITGGAAGIGMETARLFLAEGAKLVLVDLKEEALETAAATLGGDDVLTVAANVSSDRDTARYGESIDVANLVLFLASDEAAFITGGQFPVDGGLAAG